MCAQPACLHARMTRPPRPPPQPTSTHTPRAPPAPPSTTCWWTRTASPQMASRPSPTSEPAWVPGQRCVGEARACGGACVLLPPHPLRPLPPTSHAPPDPPPPHPHTHPPHPPTHTLHRLCYLFCRCTRSISVVPPAMYAHLTAFRWVGGGDAWARFASADCTPLPHQPTTHQPTPPPPPPRRGRVMCRGGDSETGSVSSGGTGGGIEFLPINKALGGWVGGWVRTRGA